ncbi:MAG: hypothetical protein ABI353_16005, partial [Isosphaeraceae bacterium]
MATVFPAIANDFGAVLATAHNSGSGVFVMTAGSGALLLSALSKLGFSAPSVGQPLRFTAFKTVSDGGTPEKFVFTGVLADATIYSATGLSGDTLTGCMPVEGTTDQAFPAGSAVETLYTAGTMAAVLTAVNALELANFHTNTTALAWLATRSTSDLPEGTNLYYTDSRVASLVSNGIGVSIQPYSSVLASLAGKSYASGKLLGGNGSGVPVDITLGTNLSFAGTT